MTGTRDRGRGQNASPTDGRHRSCGDRTQHRRDDSDPSHRPAASGSGGGGLSARVSSVPCPRSLISARVSSEMSPSAAELINCGYRESMLSVLSSSFSSGSLGSIFSHASSSVSSNSSSLTASRHHRHQYQHQPSSSSSSSSSAWRNSLAG